jgi:hypothetical protein
MKTVPRKPFPHEALVHELHSVLRTVRSTQSISDDMDQFYVEAAGYSPMERIMEENTRAFRRAETISQELVSIGAAAADAVALGLRMQGSWREYLVPYVRAHGTNRTISDAVDLVRKRKRDPLSNAI